MRAFGYTTSNEIREDEAAIVRELATRVLLGEPLQSLVNDLHARGIPTTNGGQWARSTIRVMLRNPRLTGREVGSQARSHPAILSPETFDKITELLNAPERRVHTIPSHRRYLMAGGLLVCGRCGKPMGPKGGAMSAYTCISRLPHEGCGRMRIIADRTDDAVTETVLARIALPESRKAIVAGLELKHGGPQRMQQLRDEIGEVADRAKVQELKAHLRVLADEWALVANMQEWFADLANLTPRRLAEWWTFATIEKRQMLLAHLIDVVKVQPVGRIGRYTDGGVSERLEFVWR